jgi:hypothetical protein
VFTASSTHVKHDAAGGYGLLWFGESLKHFAKLSVRPVVTQNLKHNSEIRNVLALSRMSLCCRYVSYVIMLSLCFLCHYVVVMFLM